MNFAGLFAGLFAKHREQGQSDLRSLLNRKLDGEDVPLEHIVEAAASIGLDGAAVDTMADRMARRRKVKAAAAALPGIDQELKAVAAEIAKHDAEWNDFRAKYTEAVMPLHEKRAGIEQRHAVALAANTTIFDADLLDPDVHLQLQQAREAHGRLKVEANALESKLESMRSNTRAVASELKVMGITLKDWKGREEIDFRAKHYENQTAWAVVQSTLASMAEIPALEKEYETIATQLIEARQALDEAERVARES